MLRPTIIAYLPSGGSITGSTPEMSNPNTIPATITALAHSAAVMELRKSSVEMTPITTSQPSAVGSGLSALPNRLSSSMC